MSQLTITTHDLTIEFGDNAATPSRSPGMNGIQARHRLAAGDTFAPQLVGLNYELIFDGHCNDHDLNFEPRRAPCALTPLADGTGVELHWPPTPHWGLEARITLRAVEPDMVDAEYAFTPTRRSAAGNLLGVFFANYMNQPPDLAHRFFGREADGPERTLRHASPEHGVLSTHRRAGEPAYPPMGDVAAAWMYASFSDVVFTRPYFWGAVQGVTAVWMFDPAEGLRLAHSPTGGGEGNPAWDYIFLMYDYEVGRTYRWRSRLILRPLADAEAEVEGLYREWVGEAA